MCHTVTAKYALGVNTAQMNRDHDYGGVVANQLATLEHIGMFDKKLPKPPKELEKLADYRDKNASLDARARAYLHANCSHCHRKWGGGNAEFQLLHTLPLKDLGVVEVKPGQGAFDLKDATVAEVLIQICGVLDDELDYTIVGGQAIELIVRPPTEKSLPPRPSRPQLPRLPPRPERSRPDN